MKELHGKTHDEIMKNLPSSEDGLGLNEFVQRSINTMQSNGCPCADCLKNCENLLGHALTASSNSTCGKIV